MKTIALFAYDFPHRKTHDFIVDLVASGVRDIVVLAAGKKQLKHQDSLRYFETSLNVCPPLPAEELCDKFGIPFYLVEHDDRGRIAEIKSVHQCELAIISGARIIHRDVISLFSKGVINFHPGKIPETSGLDSFFYTIKNKVPAGVTTHFIDHKVDAGRQIYFDEALVMASSTPETVLENVYQLQRAALRKVVFALSDGELFAKPIHRPAKNLPMMPEDKIDVLARFPIWRTSQVVEREIRNLFQAAEHGDVVAVRRVLCDFPAFLRQRNSSGWTPLIVAAFHQQEPVVQLLLELGSDANECGLKGTTTLMYAKTKLLHSLGPYSLLDLLILHGADCWRTDGLGRNVLDYVKETDDARMITYFKSIMGL